MRPPRVSKPCDKITDAGWCPVLRLAHPSGGVCRSCPHYTGPPARTPSGSTPTQPGLGDKIEKAIDTLTFGKAKKAANKIARMMGKKDCGCEKRKKALNRLGERFTGER